MAISSIVSTQRVMAGPSPGQIQLPEQTGPQSAVLLLFEGGHAVDLELVHEASQTNGYKIPAGASKLSGPWQLAASPPTYLKASESVEVRVTVLKGDRIDHHDIAADQIEAIRSDLHDVVTGKAHVNVARNAHTNTTSGYTTGDTYGAVDSSGVLARTRNIVTCVVENTGSNPADVRLMARYNDGGTTGPWTPASPGSNGVVDIRELASGKATRLYVRHALLHEYRLEARSSVSSSSTTLDTYETAKG